MLGQQSVEPLSLYTCKSDLTEACFVIAGSIDLLDNFFLGYYLSKDINLLVLFDCHLDIIAGLTHVDNIFKIA